MSIDSTSGADATDDPQDPVVRAGGWLFRQRSWLPVPIVVALLVLPAANRTGGLLWLGVIVVAAGEALRLWAVHHIGVVSRTRSQRLGPLIATGPFGYVRNPLYLGNIALWLGFTVSAGLLWLAPVVLVLLAVEYHAIVRWEEDLLSARIGESYRSYMSRVPRWVPSFTAAAAEPGPDGGSPWRETFYSERSTLLAVGLGYVLLWLKAGFSG